MKTVINGLTVLLLITSATVLGIIIAELWSRNDPLIRTIKRRLLRVHVRKRGIKHAMRPIVYNSTSHYVAVIDSNRKSLMDIPPGCTAIFKDHPEVNSHTACPIAYSASPEPEKHIQIPMTAIYDPPPEAQQARLFYQRN